MAATQYAVLQSQPGASVATAWPQVNTAQNLDLLQIVNEGGAILAKVDYTGAVTGGVNNGFVLTAAAVSSFVLTSVVGATGVYTGTITGGGSNAFVGKTAIIAGFSTSGNNGTFVITASSATTITVAVTTQADETHAGTAQVSGVSLATYTGTITGGGSNAFAGRALTTTGFAASSGANNVTSQTITASTATTLVVVTTTQVAETHAGVANIGAAALSGTFNTRIGQFQTRLSSSATIAQLFADAFTNPQLFDIIQVVAIGGAIPYYLDYLGVSHGS